MLAILYAECVNVFKRRETWSKATIIIIHQEWYVEVKKYRYITWTLTV